MQISGSYFHLKQAKIRPQPAKIRPQTRLADLLLGARPCHQVARDGARQRPTSKLVRLALLDHMEVQCLSRTLSTLCVLSVVLALASGYFGSNTSTRPSPSYFIVHRQLHDQSSQFERTLALSENLSRALNSVELHTLEGRLDTDEKKAAWITWKLDQMRPCFQEDQKRN